MIILPLWKGFSVLFILLAVSYGVSDAILSPLNSSNDYFIIDYDILANTMLLLGVKLF